MSIEDLPPWADGPGEILRHGLELLHEDSDKNRRLAMIAIDNSVELTIKTYLGLPKRITGLRIPRRRLMEISESFPALLDALEEYASDDQLAGVDLGQIEWYHRLRNELYHQGNGLTVERDKVDIYGQLANVLFRNLFGVELVHPETKTDVLLSEFLEAWVDLEQNLLSIAQNVSPYGSHGMTLLQAATLLEGTDIVSQEQIEEFQRLRRLRNGIVHGMAEYRRALDRDTVVRVRELSDRFKEEE